MNFPESFPTAEGRTEPAEACACAHCQSEKVIPVSELRYKEKTKVWLAEMRCGACDLTYTGQIPPSSVHSFHERQHNNTGKLIRDLAALTLENMKNAADTLAAMPTEFDLYPEDVINWPLQQDKPLVYGLQQRFDYCLEMLAIPFPEEQL